jgi:hypothetical protein
MQTDRPMTTPSKTAAQLGLSRSHFDELVRRGLVPCIDVTLPGRKRRTLRFDVDEVRRALAARGRAAA